MAGCRGRWHVCQHVSVHFDITVETNIRPKHQSINKSINQSTNTELQSRLSGINCIITYQRRRNVTKWGGGHIWRAQHRDASHAKVTSQISVGSMPRPKFWVWKWGGGTNISLPPPLKSGGGGHMPPCPPPASYASAYMKMQLRETPVLRVIYLMSFGSILSWPRCLGLGTK